MKAQYKDLEELSLMLKDMAKELWGDLASDDERVYIDTILEHFNNPKDTIYIERGKGFYIVKDETEPITPKRKILNGIRVYVKPEFRKTKVLKNFYDELFNNYPDYEIWGITEWHSEHNKVLLKRHTPVAIVYKLTHNKGVRDGDR